jgi:MFS family permease
MPHPNLLRDHGLTIGFGFLLAFLSSFGQTFFIALSVPGIQADFRLSHGAVGTLFSVATLASGMIMIYAGEVLDRVSVRSYAAISVAGLAVAAVAISLADSVALLGLSILALRLFGQGTLSHAAVTSTARLPTGIRGRAVGFASLGFQVGTALLPAVGVALIAAIGWVATWRVAALVLLGFLAAGTFVRRPSPDASAAARVDHEPTTKRLRRGDLLRDWRFWVMLPTMMGPPAISTGYFFHQRHIADSMEWGLSALALGMSFFAMGSISGALAAGWFADRVGSIRLSRFHLIPLAAASALLAAGIGPTGALVFFALVGLTGGASQVVVTTSLADIYGSTQLGMIRAMAASVMVIASAITPGLYGLAVDAGIGFPLIGIVSGLYLVAASILNLLLPARPMS